MTRILLVLLVFLTGCARINPRLDQKIDNQNGRIDEIRNNQNGIMLELGKLRQDNQIQNSQLQDVQQGLLNLNWAWSRNENSGVQILQGDGALVLVFGIAVVGLLLYHFRERAVVAEKAAAIMADEVARLGDPDLTDKILRAALNTDAEIEVYRLLVKK